MTTTYPVEVVHTRASREVNYETCRLAIPRLMLENPEQLDQLVGWFAFHVEAL